MKSEICKKCGYSLKRLMVMAMLMNAGAGVSPSPLDCEHEFGELKTTKIDNTKYYSVCCGVLMPDYPDSDFCPKCHNHTSGFTEEEIGAEEGESGRLLK